MHIASVWISSSHAAAVAAKGFHFVHAASNSFYLVRFYRPTSLMRTFFLFLKKNRFLCLGQDCGGGNFLGNSPTGNSWCDPFKTWQNAYTFDPTANLSTEQAKLVLGGQHLLWTEQSGPEDLETIVWPRAAASAEVFWTGPVPSNASGDDSKRDVRTALPRLHELVYRFRRRGVRAKSLQPEWCALRPFKCDLTA